MADAHMALLRWFVVLALLANLGYAAWSRGWLSVVGLAPAVQRDPSRLDRQIRPEAVRVLNAAAAAAAAQAAASGAAAVGPPLPAAAPMAPAAPDTAASASPGAAATPSVGVSAAAGAALACLEIGPLDNDGAIERAERALSGLLPARAWVRDKRASSAQYAVFVGPVNSRETAIARREELTRLRISFEAVELPGGEQGGYSLGLHASRTAAQAALEGFKERGLRNGSVVLLRAAGSRTWLRMERLGEAQAAAVSALGSSQQLGGAEVSDCDLGSVMSVTPSR